MCGGEPCLPIGSDDPHDAVSEAAAALLGLRSLLIHMPPKEQIVAEDVAAIVGLIHDRMRPATCTLQSYQPRQP